MYTEVTKCRICGNDHLETVLDLGSQALTGVFPKSASDPVTVGPLKLVKCVGENCCGLVQLKHSFTLSEMYGENYGYRSGLNASMVAHLKAKVERIEALSLLQDGDLVLDIGANDGTTLSLYKPEGLTLVGMDPTSAKFGKYYQPHVTAIADFFNAETFAEHFGDRKAKVITSFSMFYDLEDPIAFTREIAQVLDDDGVWVLEQSYLPSMLQTNSYDTVCHEHLEYYALGQIEWIVKECGLEVVDVELNDVNGGSFSIVVQKVGGRLKPTASVQQMRESETLLRLNDLDTYRAFERRVLTAKNEFIKFLLDARRDGKSVVALGASTKGNVVLQYSGVTTDEISCVGEVNPDKFGSVTPGTHLPIENENQVLENKPDFAVVLPWHFRAFFEQQDRYIGINLVYPLPVLEVRRAK